MLLSACALYHDFLSNWQELSSQKLIPGSNLHSLQSCDKIKQLKQPQCTPQSRKSLFKGREPAKAHSSSLHLESDEVRDGGREPELVPKREGNTGPSVRLLVYS